MSLARHLRPALRHRRARRCGGARRCGRPWCCGGPCGRATRRDRGGHAQPSARGRSCRGSGFRRSRCRRTRRRSVVPVDADSRTLRSARGRRLAGVGVFFRGIVVRIRLELVGQARGWITRRLARGGTSLWRSARHSRTGALGGAPGHGIDAQLVRRLVFGFVGLDLDPRLSLLLELFEHRFARTTFDGVGGVARRRRGELGVTHHAAFWLQVVGQQRLSFVFDVVVVVGIDLGEQRVGFVFDLGIGGANRTDLGVLDQTRVDLFDVRLEVGVFDQDGLTRVAARRRRRRAEVGHLDDIGSVVVRVGVARVLRVLQERAL